MKSPCVSADTAVPLTVRPARHPSELAAYAALLAANWEPPDTCVTQAYAGAEAALLTPRCPLRFVVGYADGEAVCGAEFRLGPGPWPEYTVWSRPPDIGGKVLLPVCYGRLWSIYAPPASPTPRSRRRKTASTCTDAWAFTPTATGWSTAAAFCPQRGERNAPERFVIETVCGPPLVFRPAACPPEIGISSDSCFNPVQHMAA